MEGANPESGRMVSVVEDRELIFSMLGQTRKKTNSKSSEELNFIFFKSAKLKSLNVQIRDNFKNNIFIVCK